MLTKSQCTLPRSSGRPVFRAPVRITSSVVTRAAADRDAASYPTSTWQLLALNATAAALVLSATVASPALATGLESITLPALPDVPQAWAGIADAQKQKIAEADETFNNSDTLKRLLEKSQDNKAKNKRDISDKYCYRQAELGIGDCGGLRYIPGVTQNGKQKTPQWLADLLGVEVPAEQLGGKTLKDFFGGRDLS